MKHKFLLGSTFAVVALLSLGMANASTTTKTEKIAPLKTTQTSDVLYFEDFEDEVGKGWANAFDIADGVATSNGSGLWVDINLEGAELSADNNYEVSFDLKYDSGDSLFFHLVGLDATNNGNIYLDLVSGGTYWRLANFATGDIYDNSGDDQGSRWIDNIRINKMKTEGVNIKFKIIEDVIEVFVDDYRIIVTTLSEFGNRRYSSRVELVKGILSGFGFDIRGAAGSAVVDNFLVKEVNLESTYYESNATIGGGGGIIPLTYANLYKENYHAEATFKIHRTLVEDGNIHAYPKLQLGSNYILGGQSGNPSTYINAQLYLDREFATGWIGAVDEGGNWSGPGSPTYVQSDYNGDVTFTVAVDVIGENIKFTTIAHNAPDAEHEVISLDTTFESLGAGIDKDELLHIAIQNEYSDCTHFEYFGFDGNAGVHATMEGTRNLVGSEVRANATIYGNATGFEWELNGEKTGITDLEFVSNEIPVGTHSLVYTNGTISSEPLTFEVFDNLITISSDKAEMYPNETATFTANLEGEFDGVTLAWKVNGETVADNNTSTLQLTNLTPGAYEVQCIGGTVESNIVTLNVKTPEIKVSTPKGAYLVGETATFTATLEGLPQDEQISWSVDGVSVNHTGLTFELLIDDRYEGGDLVEISATSASGITSNVVGISIAEDILAALEADENWTNVYTQEIDGAFGPYEVLSDGDGEYYHPTNEGGGNDAAFPAVSFSSTAWSMEYDLLIPESVSTYGGEYYVYPQLQGFDAKNPTDFVEFAVAVGSNSVRTYIKTHVSGLIFGTEDYGTGIDLTYGGGNVDFGWNHIAYVVDGNQVASYINGHMAMYFTLDFATVPSGACMSMFPGNGGGIPLGFKNFAFNSIVLPPPAVETVTVSASKVTAEVGETVVFTATIAPYNAEAKNIKWYVNGELVDCTTLSYSFTASAAGTYEIVCEIDGIRSASKTLTVNAPAPQGGGGCGGSVVAASLIVSISALVGVMGVLISKKKKED